VRLRTCAPNLLASVVARITEGNDNVKYVCLLALLSAIAVGFVPQATAVEHRALHPVAADRVELVRLLQGISVRRDETWHWQRVMRQARTPFSSNLAGIRSVAYRRWALRVWTRRAVAARREAENPPHRRQWLCIHRYEGSWTDPNAPYYGGLQMDLEFQATYGRDLLRIKGTANHWTPLEQMWVAERAYRTRGFWPWPNTARYCGLL
jgi:hypothetical protein